MICTQFAGQRRSRTSKVFPAFSTALGTPSGDFYNVYYFYG